jgi:signal recognition particle subunit SRP54
LKISYNPYERLQTVFDDLSSRLERIFKGLRAKGVLGEKQIGEGLREVKLALLEADVNYKVVKDFLDRVEKKAVGLDKIKGISPGQHIVKVVHEELVEILGKSQQDLQFSPEPPTLLLLLGLQGSGKTTTAVKLTRFIEKKGKKSYLIAADIYRPAAVEQLTILAESAGVPVYSGEAGDPVGKIVSTGVETAVSGGAEVIVIDTAGRLHCDQEMVSEVQMLVKDFNPHEILLVIDGMTGQDAVNIADTFHREIGITGVILTKMEGDARGGAALSIHGVTTCPIKFIGVGEGLDDIEIFYPDRMASRILNKGDIVTLVEKAQRTIDQEELEKVEKKIRTSGEFDLNDFLTSIRQLRKMGPMNQLLELIPGVKSLQPGEIDVDPDQVSRVEAIILSMTPEERRYPEAMDGSRRLRVARGSGTTIQEVNKLLNQFKGMKKLFKESGKMIKGKQRKKEIGLWQ